jgi:hypothetical protein
VLWVRYNDSGPEASLETQSDSSQKSDGQDDRPRQHRSAGPSDSSWAAMKADCPRNYHPLPPMGKEYDAFLAI